MMSEVEEVAADTSPTPSQLAATSQKDESRTVIIRE